MSITRDNFRGNRTGMAAMAVAALLLPFGDAFSKLLTGVMPPFEVTMWRLLAQTLWLVPIAIVLRHRLHGSMFSPVVALAGALTLAALAGLIGAFAVMPIATAIAIFFVEPLLLTLLSWPLLGERIGLRRIAACALGLVGAMIVIRPGFASFGAVALLPLMAALAFALNMIVLRVAGRTRSALTVQCGAIAYAAVLTVIAVILARWTGVMSAADPLPGWAWWAMLAAGGLAAAAYVAMAEAMRRAEAGAVAPMQYLEILGATLVGWVVFGTFPDWPTWVGVSIILASGLYVLRREDG